MCVQHEYGDVGDVDVARSADGNNIDVMATSCPMRYRYYQRDFILTAEGET